MGDRSLEGKVALITGAGRGIGRHVAEWLAHAGARLVLCARSREEVAMAARELASLGTDVIAETCDVAEPGAVTVIVERATDRFGSVDVAIANAAILGPVGAIDRTEPDHWAHTIQVNVSGTAAVVRAVVPVMRARGWGRILTMSGGGVGGPTQPERVSAYVASKGAVVVLTEALAKEMPDGVTINAIAPGAIATGFMNEVIAVGPEVAGVQLFETVRQGTDAALGPLRDLVLYMTSDESAWLNGRCLSARWDPPNVLRTMATTGIDGARFRLRRIDEDLFGVRQGASG
jgi:NAD(P)-dependent dehydrogenase (short-subunit alcohol dehydrogenase family)